MENILQRTIKVKIRLDEQQLKAVSLTIDEAQKVFILFVALGKEYKSCSYIALHKYGYEKAKELCPTMPTALIQCVAKSALGGLKAWNTSNPKKKWQYEGKRKAQSLPLGKLTLSRRGNLTTVSTVAKRIRILHDIPAWFEEKYEIDANNVQAGSLILRGKQAHLSLVYRVQPKITRRKSNPVIVGVDRGLYNLCTLSTGEIFSNKPFIAIKRKYQHNRSMLQQKGTRSAHRKLKKLAGREMRFMRDVNHKITKKLAGSPQVVTYVLEDLSGIRRKRRGKKLNSWLGNWSFHQFQTILEYKCEYNHIEVVYVDPRYTSQKCNACGVTNKNNRKKSRYVCGCGYSEHADINAAKNIRDNHALACTKDRPPQPANSNS